MTTTAVPDASPSEDQVTLPALSAAETNILNYIFDPSHEDAPIKLITDMGARPLDDKFYNIFNASEPNSNGIYGLPAKADALVLSGTDNAHILFDQNAAGIIVGNNGNDTIEAHGGIATGTDNVFGTGPAIFLGSGTNTLDLSGQDGQDLV